MSVFLQSNIVYKQLADSMKSVFNLIVLLMYAKCCFIVHFVHYGQLCCFNLDRLIKFNHPFTVHFDEPLNHKLKTNLLNVEKSDIKRFEVLWKFGGLYLDTDHLVDIQCIKEVLCKLPKVKKNLYFLDLSQEIQNTTLEQEWNWNWNQSVPSSFIYSPSPKNQLIQEILSNYNQSQNDPVNFSGPYYLQKFRSQLSFVKIDKNCSSHIATRSWNGSKNNKLFWTKNSWRQYKILKTKIQPEQLNKIQKLYISLFKTHSIFYPGNFDLQDFVYDQRFNHVQIINRNTAQIKILRFSNNQTKKKQLINYVTQINNQKQSRSRLKQQQILLQNLQRKLDLQKQNLKQQKIKSKKVQMELIMIKNLIQSQEEQQKNSEPTESQRMSRVYQFSKNATNVLLDTFIIMLIIGMTIKTIRHFFIIKRTKKLPKLKDFIGIIYQQKYSSKIKNLSGFTFLTTVFFIVLSMHPYIQQQFNLFQKQQELELANNITIEHQSFAQDTRTFNQKFGIQFCDLMDDPLYQVDLKKLHILTQAIQIGSKFDYLEIQTTKQFYSYQKQFLDEYPHQVYYFAFNKSVQRQKKLMTYTQFESIQQIQQQLQNIQKWGNSPKLKNNIQLHLASYLRYNSTSERVKQLQYYYYNKTFNLDSIENQTHMCIISTGYQVFTKNKFKYFFQSIQRQNYTNYSVVIVDDNSPDQSPKKFMQYLNSTDYMLKNKVRFIKSLKRIGALANAYLNVRLFCPKDSVVLNVDNDDGLIGFQALNILNAAYQDQNIWYVYTKYFRQLTPSSEPKMGQYSVPLTVNISQYRTHKDWNTSHMRTFRQRVMDRVPVQQFLQYYYDQEEKILLPRFHVFAPDRFQIYSHIQISGDDRVKHLEVPLYFYDQSGTPYPCHYVYQHYIQKMSKTKRRIKRLDSIDSDLQYYPDEEFPKKLMDEYQQSANNYFNCLQIYQPSKNLS